MEVPPLLWPNRETRSGSPPEAGEEQRRHPQKQQSLPSAGAGCATRKHEAMQRAASCSPSGCEDGGAAAALAEQGD
eukprot:9602103-Alexandrium_andersonii.AAC.1